MDSTTQSQIEVLHTLVENLRSNEKEYARVLNDVPIVVLMLDVRGRILFLNHAWSELSGYSSIDATGQPLAMFLAHPEEDQVLPASKLIAVADKPIKNLECRLIRNDGRTVWCTYSAVYNDEDNTVSGTLFDVSEQKKIEKERQVLEKSRAEFYSSISHDLRAPLLTVIGGVDQLTDAIYDEKAKSTAGRIRTCANQLLGMLDGILQYSSLETNEAKLNNRILNLHDLVNYVIHTLQPVAAHKKLTLDYEVKSNVPEFVRSDEVKLRRILESLINNAIKFTKEGGITVCLQSERCENHLKLKWSVEDTGIGIPSNEIESIFNPYSQVENEVSDDRGIGLGLAITEQLVKLFDGEIEVKSQEGVGTTFYYSTVAHMSDKGEAEMLKYFSNKLRPEEVEVLIVDDDRTEQIVLSSMLQNEGIKKTNIDIAPSKSQAEKLIAEGRKYNVIFMDCYLGDGHGAAMVSDIRNNPNLAAQPCIIACTASTSEKEFDDMTKAGADDLLTKPVTKENLKSMMSRYFY